MEKRLAYLAIILVFALGAFVGFRLRGPRPGPTAEGEPKRDTLWLHDTIKIAAPKPKPIRIHDTLYLAAPVPPPDTSGHRPDTVFVPVPRQTDYYHGEQYEAWITGYQATLDSLHVFQNTAVVEVPVYKTVTKHARWGVGIQAGVTYLPGQNGGVTPYVGLGISYNLLTF